MTGDLSADIEVMVEVTLPAGAVIDDLASLARHVLHAEGVNGQWVVTVVLTSDDVLRALHRDFMGIDAETDVMTFPTDSDPVGETRGGDIVISVDRAAEQAPEFGLTSWEEVHFLLVHGILHLCGWVDDTTGKREAMLERQKVLIDEFDVTRR